MITDAILLLSIRASERIPTVRGHAVSHVRPLIPSLRKWITSECLRLKSCKPSLELATELDKSDVLPVLRACLDSSFDAVECHPLGGDRLLKVNLQGVTGGFVSDLALVSLASANGFGQVEGDEVLVAFALRRVEIALANTTLSVVLESHPGSLHDAVDLIKQLGCPVASTLESAITGADPKLRAGFYIIPIEEPNPKDIESVQWHASKCAAPVLALLASYLFRCYLCAQRLERQLLAFEPAGDWDHESRAMLLARSRHLVLTRFALLKNRAVLGKPILIFYDSALVRLRLKELSGDLGVLLASCNDVLQGRNAYFDTSRIRTIETVLFAASALSLAVALNAIQMPPFYDAHSENAIMRREFWVVVVLTILLFVILWGGINGWRHARKILRSLKRVVKQKVNR